MVENSNNHKGDGFCEEVQQKIHDEMRPRRLELHLFSGDNPYGWLNRAERYFHFNAIDDKDKLEATVVCLEGRAPNWFQWWETRTPIGTWDVFRVAII